VNVSWELQDGWALEEEWENRSDSYNKPNILENRSDSYNKPNILERNMSVDMNTNYKHTYDNLQLLEIFIIVCLESYMSEF
jgi:hypothetical protein